MSKSIHREWIPPVWLVALVLGVVLAATPRACDQMMAFYGGTR